MDKVKIEDVAKELGTNNNVLLRLKKEKLRPEHWTGVGKNTLFTQEGVELLRLALDVPLAVPDKLYARALHPARNDRWWYCQIEGRDGKVPVAIPRKLRTRFEQNKRIPVDAIKDATGVTYRYATH